MAKAETSREAQLENIMLNQSVIFISTFMQGFGEAFQKLASAMAVGVAGAVGSFQSPEAAKKMGDDVAAKMQKIDIPEELKKEIMKSKTEIKAQMNARRAELSKALSDPVFDEGIKIVNSYDFKGLPRINEELSDEQTAAYMVLFRNLDPQFTKMFKELTAWQEKAQAKMKEAMAPHKS